MKPILTLCLLAGALFLAGCSTLAPGADPIEVRAEQTEGFAADTMDFFLHVEYDNVDFCRTNLPAVHAFAEWLRQTAILGTNVWPRDIGFIQSFDATRKAYKANRTPDNKASLTAGLAALEAALTQVEQQLATLGSNPFVQQHSSPAVRAQLQGAISGHSAVAAPAPVTSQFSPLPPKP